MLRNLGKRVVLFCSGLLVLALGVVLVIGFFQIEATIPKLGGYVFLVPLFGIGLLWAAFSKTEPSVPAAAEQKPLAEPPPLPPRR